jgi:glycosyltransferase involved in cell wall biosynthesis
VSRPLVSVVIPFLNAAAFLEETIQSVLAQTYNDWELLLVDDGSTDASSDIAQGHARRRPGQIRYLDHDGHQNNGTPASRNLGISTARGEHIAPLDADDVWLPHHLDLQVGLLHHHREAAMVYGPAHVWHSWTKDPRDAGRDRRQQLGVPGARLYHPPLLLAHFLRDDGFTPCPSAVVARRDVVDAVGGFQDAYPFPATYEDQAFYAKVCLREPVFISEKVSLKYRRHPSSVMSVAMKTGQHARDRQSFLIWLEHYLIREGHRDHGVWAALRRELFPYRHPRLHRIKKLTHRLARKTVLGGR